MSQTLQIPPESAPILVSKNGGSQMTGLGGLDWNPLPVQRFVERVLGAAGVGIDREPRPSLAERDTQGDSQRDAP